MNSNNALSGKKSFETTTLLNDIPENPENDLTLNINPDPTDNINFQTAPAKNEGKKSIYNTKSFKVILQIVLTLIIFFAEAITGYFTNCLALLSDSFHTLSDVISLSIGLIAIRTTHKKNDSQYSHRTFGYHRAEVLGGIIQAVFLYALCFNIYISAIKRFIDTETLTDVHLILTVGGIGLIINLIGVFNFWGDGEHGHSHGGHGHSHGIPKPIEESHFSLHVEDVPHKERQAGNLNTRGIFLHILGDTLGSVAVMISACLLWYFDNDTVTHPWLLYIDPALTFIIATIIALSTYPLLISSITILMEHAPDDIDLKSFQRGLEAEIKKIGFAECFIDVDASSRPDASADISRMSLFQNPNLDKSKMLIHDLHIWQLSSTKRAATIHVVISRCKQDTDTKLLDKYLKVVGFLKKEFEKYNIYDLTIQPEFLNMRGEIEELCNSGNCNGCGGDCEESHSRSEEPDKTQVISAVQKVKIVDIEDLVSDKPTGSSSKKPRKKSTAIPQELTIEHYP